MRAWLRANLPWEYGVGLPPRYDDLAEEVADGRAWQAKLAAARYVGVTWPEEYGGRGAGPLEHYIVQEELARARAPELVGRIGVNLAGPTLLAHGTPEQKQRWLPGILDASTICVPALQRARCRQRPHRPAHVGRAGRRRVAPRRAEGVDVLRPVRRLGHLPRPHRPRRARSAKGISFFVVDMTAPGVEVRPLVQLTGEAEFNEVFLADVFVADDQLVGELNDGWQVANSTLSHERGTNPRQLVIHAQLIEELLRDRRRQRHLRRPAGAARAGAGLHRGAASSSSTTGGRCRGSPRARSRDRRAAP